ncbi:MAG: aldose 1-epimerase [Solirubrobacteraceae bacterium]
MTHTVREAVIDGLAAVELSAPDAAVEATFVPGAGMLGASLRHRGEELLHLPGGVSHYVQTGSSAGIPLLYPWANRLAGWTYEAAGQRVELRRDGAGIRTEEHGLPIHGLLAAARGWDVEEIAADDDSARFSAGFDFASQTDLLASFPFPHRLRIVVTLAHNELRVATSVEANAGVTVPVSFGFHPYLRLPGVARQQWEVALKAADRLVLDHQLIPTGAREPAGVDVGPLGERTFDDGFSGLGAPPQFRLAGGGRTIEVALESGYPFTQLFAPPGSAFICVEPMTAPTNALVSGGAELPLVEPGERFEAAFCVIIAA